MFHENFTVVEFRSSYFEEIGYFMWYLFIAYVFQESLLSIIYMSACTFMGLLYENTPSYGVRTILRDTVPADRNGNAWGADG